MCKKIVLRRCPWKCHDITTICQQIKIISTSQIAVNKKAKKSKRAHLKTRLLRVRHQGHKRSTANVRDSGKCFVKKRNESFLNWLCRSNKSYFHLRFNQTATFHYFRFALISHVLVPFEESALSKTSCAFNFIGCGSDYDYKQTLHSEAVQLFSRFLRYVGSV